jgi:hypothetical protein
MKKDEPGSKFQTHIKEPIWQQVLSVIVVVIMVALFIWFSTQSK